MTMLSVLSIGLLLLAFISHSLQMTEVKSWAEFEPLSKKGAVVLTLYDDALKDATMTAMNEWCAKFPNVNCFYATEKTSKGDSFFDHFNNADLVLLAFYKSGTQTDLLIAAAAKRGPIEKAFEKIK